MKRYEKDTAKDGTPQWKQYAPEREGRGSGSEKDNQYLLEWGNHAIRIHVQDNRVSVYYDGNYMGEATGPIARVNFRVPDKKSSDFYELSVLTSPGVRIFIDRNGKLYAHK